MIIKCRECNKDIDIPVTPEQYDNWRKGMLIQNAMPNISPGKREMFITQICNWCWHKMFAEGSNQ